MRWLFCDYLMWLMLLFLFLFVQWLLDSESYFLLDTLFSSLFCENLGRWCICWRISVSVGSREEHRGLCKSWVLRSKCHNTKVRLHLPWEAWFWLGTFDIHRWAYARGKPYYTFDPDIIFALFSEASCLCASIHLCHRAMAMTACSEFPQLCSCSSGVMP